MLTKPLTHLRPLLRLPSHPSPTPEHFSSNPSLLHHLPHNPASSLVSASQSSAQAAGASQNAGTSGAGSGRSGWGAGTGNNGGYTGHARAFLSFQHGNSLDASSTLVNTSDDSNRNKQSLLLKHRLARSTQIVQLEGESVARNVHRSIEARSGPKVGIVEIEGRQNEQERLLEDAPRSATRRRSSIAFPSSITSTPCRISSPITTTPQRILPRSQSTLDLWHIGPTRTRELGVRHLSTRSSTIPLPSLDEIEKPVVSAQPTPSIRTLGQPNRVLMDLAGIDLPGRPAQAKLVRRNSTASFVSANQRALEDEASEIAAQTDLNFFRAIESSITKGDETTFRNLMARYRASRTPDVFNIANQSASSSTNVPVPETYTTPLYNILLDGIMKFRQAGESIAPILEVYNEMLERDCIPNGRTYNNVILALCAREIDVIRATRDWERSKAWARWKAEKLEEPYDESVEAENQAIIEGYQAEGNFASALKLWTALIMRTNAAEVFRARISAQLMRVAAEKDLSEREMEIVDDLMDFTIASNVVGHRRMLGNHFIILAKAGKVEELEKKWEKFRSEDVQKQYQSVGLWLPYVVLRDTERGRADREVRITWARSRCWVDAAVAFLRVGNVQKAESIWSELVSAQKEDAKSNNSGVPDLIEDPDYATYGSALLKADVGKGIEFFLSLSKHAAWPKVQLVQLDDLYYAILKNDQYSRVLELLGAPYAQHRLTQNQVSWILTSITDAGLQGRLDLESISKIVKLCSAVPIPLDFDILRNLIQLAAASQDLPEQNWNVADVFKSFTSGSEVLDEEGLEILNGMIKSVILEFPFNNETSLNNETSPNSETSPFRQQLDFLSNASIYTRIQDEDVARIVGERFAEMALREKSLPNGIGIWETFIDIILAYPADQPELDNAFATVAEALPNANTNLLRRLSTRSSVKSFADRLHYRVGRERAVELLKPAFGEHWAEQTVQLAAPPLASESTEAESITESPFPPLPEFATLPPGLPQSLTLSRPLSTQVDRQSASHDGITASEAFEIHQRAVASGQVAHPEVIARLLDNIARDGREDDTRYLYALAHHVIQTVLPESERAAAWYSLENLMLIATCHLGYLEEAGMYRARLYQAGMAPSADAFATMIACSKDTTDDSTLARELFDESAAAGNTPNLFLYNTIISKMSKARKADAALEYFKDLKAAGLRPSPVTYGAVINACCRVGDGESAETLFQEMVQSSNYKPRVPPYNTMMQFHLTNQPSRERVLYYYDAMRQNKVRPTAHTYKLLLDAFAVLPPINLQAMEKVFDDLIADRSTPVQGTHWASVITGYGLSGNDPDKALQIFYQIPSVRQARVNLNNEPVVWEAILNVIAQKGTVQQLQKIAQEMFASKAKVTAYVYNVLISGYARAGHIDEARRVFGSMGDSATGVAAPNNHPQLYTSSGHVKPSTMTRTPTQVVFREPSTYEAMIKAELEAGNREAAVELLRMMEVRQYPYAVFMRVKALLDDTSSTSTPTQDLGLHVFKPIPTPSSSEPQSSPNSNTDSSA